MPQKDVYLFIFSLVLVIHAASCCILLLNGWTPVPIKERANLAQIVAEGYILATYKGIRTQHKTYTAQIELTTIYKGEDLVDKLMPGTDDDRIYNISNFGDRAHCYADVTKGESYLLFLTSFDDHISAKYDDIFGATADNSDENVQLILLGLGWDNWSEWTPCSRTCESGSQTRDRKCHLNASRDCEGNSMEKRRCNRFSCEDVIDLLPAFGIADPQDGVEPLTSRPHAYKVDTSATLETPMLSREAFPTNFSVVMSVKPATDWSGYIFTITDPKDKQKLGIRYDDGEMHFEYYDHNGLPGEASPVFEIDLSDGSWHLVAFEVEGQEVTLYEDCDVEISESLLRSAHPDIGEGMVMSLGRGGSNRDTAYEGEIEQLIISPDPHLGRRACIPLELAERENHQKDSEEMGTHVPEVMTTASSVPTVKILWTDWRPCSTTCGKGVKTRALYCTDTRGQPVRCLPTGLNTTQTAECQIKPCPGACEKDCFNGGACRAGQCYCPEGFYGEQCQTPTCYPGCYNGGYCVRPGECLCPPGFTGDLCQTANCHPACENGGVCVRPGLCSCPHGYQPPVCTPHCSIRCENGGSCVAPNICRCPEGYHGRRCDQVTCTPACQNGGSCLAENDCTCPNGFTGQHCEKTTCFPECQNGGKCLYPHQCKCRKGTSGAQCQNFTCGSGCKHRGKCVGPDKCKCTKAYRGKRCRKSSCRRPCLNGGKCVGKNKCRCPKDYRGRRCHRKKKSKSKCRKEPYLQPYYQSFRHPVRQQYLTYCGTWKLHACVMSRVKYIIVFKQFYRVSYRCKSRKKSKSQKQGIASPHSATKYIRLGGNSLRQNEQSHLTQQSNASAYIGGNKLTHRHKTPLDK